MISFLTQTEVKNLVIADDDPDDRDLYREALDDLNAGLNLLMYCNGDQLMRDTSRLRLADLMIIDLNMPYKNGFECLEELRREPLLKTKPLVVFSTSKDPDEINRCYDMGANLFVVKPDSYTAIRRIMRTLLLIDWKKFEKLERSYFARTALAGVDIFYADIDA